jgi:hypothetical protein
LGAGFGFENASNGSGLIAPPFGFRRESSPAIGGQGVVCRAPIVFRGALFRPNAARAFHTAQRWQQRSRIHPEDATADLLNPQRNSIPMHRFERQSLQNEHFQSRIDLLPQEKERERSVSIEAKSPIHLLNIEAHLPPTPVPAY